MAKLDKKTLELPGLPLVPVRGRPPTGQAKSPAERMAAMRKRRREEVKQAHRAERRRSLSELVEALSFRLLADDPEGAYRAWVELGLRNEWKLP